MTIAENIKRIREEKNMTQKAVATLMGISQQAYSQYESGTREPKPETLGRIAAALGTDIIDITRNTDTVDSCTEESLNEYVRQFVEGEFSQIMAEKAGFEKTLAAVPYAAKMWNAFEKLNEVGQEKAAERVQELAQIPAYQRPADAVQSAAGDTGDKEPEEK